MPLTLNGFGGYLTDWTKKYEDEFSLYYPLKGGWEAWVQASVAAYIISQDDTVDILREQAIFQIAQQKVDWLFNNNAHQEVDKIAVELKCQSLQNQANFTNGLQADIDKMAVANIKVGYKGSQRAVVGIGFTQDALTWMRDTKHFTILHHDVNTACGILVLG